MDRRAFLTCAIAAGGAVILTPAVAADQSRSGKFTKQNNYAVGGSAELVQDAGGYTVRLSDDFRFGNAPDPKIALGRNGYDKSTLMGLLKSKRGASTYRVPASVDTQAYNEIWIWCERFNVPLAVAGI